MLLPFLSAVDPAANTEGTIDPLGLYSIADALALKMIPGVRERMWRPRFLTAAAVSAAVCGDFGEDDVAADNVTPPWLVFEWHVIEGLVRGIKEKERLTHVPGRDKVGKAIEEKARISARRYLKTPVVFGFHGVYRLLSRTINIESDGRLGETGYRLLEVWRDEKNLPGFYESKSGRGADLFRLWREAVRDGLKRGAVDRTQAWQGWRYFTEYLAPDGAGPDERKFLERLFVGIETGYVKEVMDYLVSEEGKEIYQKTHNAWEEKRVWSERPFQEALIKTASPGLRELLDAISAYESFARLLQDAFDDCLYIMSKYKSRIHARELTEGKLVLKAAAEIPAGFEDVAEALAPAEESLRFKEDFQFVAEKMPTKDWVVRLMEHHHRVQAKKPPNGKLPWVERFDDGRFIIRPGYYRQAGGLGDKSFVHRYRLNTLWSFSKDLRLV